MSDILQTQANVNAVAHTHILNMVAFESYLSVQGTEKQMHISTCYNEEKSCLYLSTQFISVYLQLPLASCWKYFSCALVSSWSQSIHGKKPGHDFRFVSLFKELISIILGRFMTKVIAATLEPKQAINLCPQPGPMT